MAKFLVFQLGNYEEPVIMQVESFEDLLTSQQFIGYLEEDELIEDDENDLKELADIRIYDEKLQLQKFPNKKLVKTFVLEDV